MITGIACIILNPLGQIWTIEEQTSNLNTAKLIGDLSFPFGKVIHPDQLFRDLKTLQTREFGCHFQFRLDKSRSGIEFKKNGLIAISVVGFVSSETNQKISASKKFSNVIPRGWQNIDEFLNNQNQLRYGASQILTTCLRSRHDQHNTPIIIHPPPHN